MPFQLVVCAVYAVYTRADLLQPQFAGSAGVYAMALVLGFMCKPPLGFVARCSVHVAMAGAGHVAPALVAMCVEWVPLVQVYLSKRYRLKLP